MEKASRPAVVQALRQSRNRATRPPERLRLTRTVNAYELRKPGVTRARPDERIARSTECPFSRRARASSIASCGTCAWTRSRATIAPAIPGPAGQWDLSRMLADELRALGAADVTISANAVVMATVPATLGRPDIVPVVGLIAHVDTSPAVSGANVTPIVHRNYRGGDLILPGDPFANHPRGRAPRAAR